MAIYKNKSCDSAKLHKHDNKPGMYNGKQNASIVIRQQR